MKRKILAMFLALALMLSAVPVAFADEPSPYTVTVGSAEAAPGDTVILPVTLSNNQGFGLAGFSFRVLKDGEIADASCGVSITGSFVDGTEYGLETGLLAQTIATPFFTNTKAYACMSVSGNVCYEDGVLFYIVVAVAENAQPGNYEIELYINPSNVSYYFSDGLISTWTLTDNPIINGIITVTDGTGGDPAPVDSPYAVTLEPSKESIAMGENVDVGVVVTGENGEGFNAYDITVTYDPTLFTYGTNTTGKINITDYDKDFASGATIATLTFTAKDDLTPPVTGTFGVSAAKIAVKGEALTKDAYPADTTAAAASVQILPQYAVTFVGQDGEQIGNPVTVTEGGKVAAADIPAASEIPHYTFLGWDDGTGTRYSAAEIAGLAVTAAVTYTAVYEAETYTVTLGEGLSGADTATYGQDYTGTVDGYNSNYDYTVTAAFADGTTEDYEVVNGSFTIPKEDIAGAMTLSVSRVVSGVTVEVYEDYVGGYSLVVAYGGSDVGYLYNGEAMYRTAHYDADTAAETDKAYAYIILGTTSKEEVLAALTVAGTAAEAVTAANDVNDTGILDIADVQAVADCYNIAGAVAEHMPVYLRADVVVSHKVDSEDAAEVLQNLPRN